MESDLNALINFIILSSMFTSWIIAFASILYMMFAWVLMLVDAKKSGKFWVLLFPVFLFNDSMLSSAGKKRRKFFFKASIGLLLSILVLSTFAYSGISWSTIKYSEGVLTIGNQ
ncbi:hypothetical protein [Gynuella sp.]|uniref:hypothetical protein n=1 Tax=Gynuella sp. TaxID=2969146 RepID=UPI003D0F5EFB